MASESRWHRGLLALILGVFVVMSTAFNVLQPIGEAPDEPAHLEFVQYIQQHHALPTNPPNAPAHLDPLAPGIEYDQVPLYYTALAILLGPIWLPAGARLHRDPFIGWPGHPWQRANDLHWTDEGWPYHGLSLVVHGGRVVSTLLGIVTLLATYGLVRRLAHANGALFATAWLGWNPGFLLTSSHLNNDSAATAASTLVLLGSTYLLTSRRPRLLTVLAVSLALTAALLSKVHTLFLIPVVIVAVARTLPVGRTRIQSLVAWAAVVGAVLTPALGSLGLWWIAVGHTFDRRLNVAVGAGVATVAARANEIDWNRLPAAISWFNSTWWGGIGAGVETLWLPILYVALAVPVVTLGAAGSLAVCRGSARIWSDRPSQARQPVGGKLPRQLVRWNSWPLQRRAAFFLGLDAIPLFYATISRQVFPWVDLDANSRFVMPAAATIALIVTVGGIALPFGRARRPLAVGYVLGIFGLSLATMVYLLPQISAPTIPARLARSPAEASAQPLATFASGVELLAVENVPPSLVNGSALHLNLRWRVVQTPSDNFIVFAHVFGRGDERLTSTGHDEIPYEQTYPPTLWQAGEIVDEPQNLAAIKDLRPGLYSLEVGMYRLRSGNIDPITATGPSAAADRVVVATWKVLPTASAVGTSHPVDALFGDDLLLATQSVSAEPDGVHVTLTWRAIRALARPLVVSVQVLDPAGKLIAQHDGEPFDGRLPTTSWAAGDSIQETYVVAGAPTQPDLPIVVVVYDRETLGRLSVVEPGRAATDHVTLER